MVIQTDGHPLYGNKYPHYEPFRGFQKNYGATGRDRTADILITSEVLCHLSYGGFFIYYVYLFKYRVQPF